MVRRRHNAVPTEVNLPDGSTLRCRSMFEAGVVLQVARAGAPWSYEEDRLVYDVPHVYIPDITLKLPGCPARYIEAKGYLSVDDRRKLKAVKDCNPGIDLRIVFQKANTKLSRRPKSMTYSTWAETVGLPWAEGLVPASWLRR